MRAAFLSITIALLSTLTVPPAEAAVPTAAMGTTPTVSYSADAIIETADGALRSKMYAAPGMERREDLTDAGETMISIRRDDLGKMWMLMPSERMYIEIDLKKAAAAAERIAGGVSRTASPEEYETEMTEVGREEVNGMMTTKSKVIMTGQDGTKMGGFWWNTDEGILVKMDVIAVDEGEKMRMKRELSNILIEPQDPALFEIPEGYSSMMAGIGASMLGIPGLGGGAAEGAAEEPPKKKWGLGTLKGVLDAVQ